MPHEPPAGDRQGTADHGKVQLRRLPQASRWTAGSLAYGPDDFADPAPVKDSNSSRPQCPHAQLARVQRKATTRGLRACHDHRHAGNERSDWQAIRYDEDGAPIEEDDTESSAFYSFALWENAIINGQVRQSGVQNLRVPEDKIESHYPA